MEDSCDIRSKSSYNPNTGDVTLPVVNDAVLKISGCEDGGRGSVTHVKGSVNNWRNERKDGRGERI